MLKHNHLQITTGRDPVSCVAQPDPSSTNIAAQAKIGGADEDVRAVMRGLTPEKRELVFRRGRIPLADWQAKEKRIDSSFWDELREKGAGQLLALYRDYARPSMPRLWML